MQTKSAATTFKWSVSQKLAVLLLLPLTVQVLLLFGLLGLLDSTQKLAELEAKQSELVDRLNALLIDGANAWGSIITPVITGRQMESISPESYHKKVEADYDAIMRLKSVNAEVLGLLKDIKQISDDEYKTLKKLQKLPEEGSPLDGMFERIQIVRPQLRTMGYRISLLKEAMNAETRKLEQTRKRERSSRRQVKVQILLGIILDIIFAVCMLLVFGKSMNQRLQKLIGNAQVVPVADTLPEQVDGTDELAYLDKILHTAVSDLRSARQHRAAVSAMVAHDLRTPLLSISLAAEALKSTAGLQEIAGVSKHMKSLNMNMRRVLSLVEDLLTIEKIESGKLELKLENFVLSELVQDAVEALDELASKKAIRLKNDTDAPELVADKDRILQVLLNYLSNAIKFSPENSEIVINSELEKDRVIVNVIDQGPGLSQEEQSALFNKFYQTSIGKKEGGVGLGLSICRMLVSKHGGETGVESLPGMGSRFWFSLPYDEDF